jgi:RNA polymerase sigma-70 factor (ECF subfamily)
MTKPRMVRRNRTGDARRTGDTRRTGDSRRTGDARPVGEGVDSDAGPRAADGQALNRALRRELPAVRHAVRRVLGNDSELDDITQQALVEARRALRGFRGESALRTWLTRIAIRVAWTHVRLRSKVSPLTVAHHQRAAPQHEPIGPESYCELARLERRLIALPAAQRRVFVMHEIQGHTVREISRVLQIPPGTVSSRLRKARERVRRLLLHEKR